MSRQPAQLDLNALAAEIRQAQDSAASLLPFSARFPGFELTHGYAVAALLDNARRREGEIAVGRKLGFTNAEMWPIYDVLEPIWARLYRSSVTQLKSTNSNCALSGFVEPIN